jgi:hypothetical protein
MAIPTTLFPNVHWRWSLLSVPCSVKIPLMEKQEEILGASLLDGVARNRAKSARLAPVYAKSLVFRLSEKQKVEETRTKRSRKADGNSKREGSLRIFAG